MEEFVRPDILRPPSEHASYYLPLTNGCSNNKCTFCNFYGCELRIRDIAEVKKEIDAVALFLKTGMRLPAQSDIVYYLLDNWDGKDIFLQDGDALVYPYPKLVEILDYINEKLPNLRRIACYGTSGDVRRRTVDELKELKKRKLGIIYLGLESGDEETLVNIGKHVTSDEMIEAAIKVKQSGIILSVTVLLGVAGKEKSQQHARATAAVLTQMDPEFVGALTLMFVQGTPMYENWQNGTFHPVSKFESLMELRTIIAEANFTSCFFSSMHASNYISVRGTLPGDKERMLSQIDRVLDSKDPALLRPDYLRGL
jgi:radical SAM superfamily enzyme YgiQ (UPF0313 family)